MEKSKILWELRGKVIGRKMSGAAARTGDLRK